MCASSGARGLLWGGENRSGAVGCGGAAKRRAVKRRE